MKKLDPTMAQQVAEAVSSAFQQQPTGDGRAQSGDRGMGFRLEANEKSGDWDEKDKEPERRP